nr:DoxX family protein [uncultured Eudoraea sp.]
MHREFQRFGLTNFRKLTGILQLLGATGLLIGFIYPLMTVIASAGLAILMLLGFFVRIKIKDGLLVSFPAFAFMLINLYIFLSSYSGL